MKNILYLTLLSLVLLICTQACTTDKNDLEELVDPANFADIPLKVTIIPMSVAEYAKNGQLGEFTISWSSSIDEVIVEAFLIDGEPYEFEYPYYQYEGRYAFIPNKSYHISLISSVGTYSANITALGEIVPKFPSILDPTKDIELKWSVSKAVNAQSIGLYQGWADVDYNVFSDSYKQIIYPSKRKLIIPSNSINEIPEYAMSGSYIVQIHAVNFVNFNDQCLFISEQDYEATYSKSGDLNL